MSKGSRREREAVKLYQQAGMATYRPATVKFGENDIFGLFDLLAVSPLHNAVHAVQVKSNHATGIRSWARHTVLWRRLGWRCFYAVPVDSEGWRLIETLPHPVVEYGNLTKQRVDERDSDCQMGQEVIEWLREQSARSDNSPNSGD